MRAGHTVRRARNQSHGFTLVELLVVIGIIAVLISILLPTITRAKEQAKSAVCLSNLRQIGTGFALYANDFSGYIPPHGYRSLTNTPPGYVVPTSYHTWFTIFIDRKYLSAPTQLDPTISGSAGNSVLRCPSGIEVNASPFTFTLTRGLLYSGGASGYLRATSPDSGLVADCFYGSNGSPINPAFPMPRIPQDGGSNTNYPGKYNVLFKMSQVHRSSDTWVIADGNQWHSRTSLVWGLYPRHGKDERIVNCLFLDSHAQQVDTRGWTTITSLPIVNSQWQAQYDALTTNITVPFPRWKVK